MQNRVKELRSALALSQDAFGEKIGYKGAAVSLWEAGKRTIPDSAIKSICREFRVSETWLRTGAGDMKADTTREEELGELLGSLLADRPESFRTALITTLLRYSPDGPEWEVLERICADLVSQLEAESPPGHQADPAGATTEEGREPQ